MDYLAFSCHKMLAPFGVGVLYAKEHLLAAGRPFLYGGDMIAEGRVAPDRVDYNDLPWKYAAGTPNILGVIASARVAPAAASTWSGRRGRRGGSTAIFRCRDRSWHRTMRPRGRAHPLR